MKTTFRQSLRVALFSFMPLALGGCVSLDAKGPYQPSALILTSSVLFVVLCLAGFFYNKKYKRHLASSMGTYENRKASRRLEIKRNLAYFMAILALVFAIGG